MNYLDLDLSFWDSISIFATHPTLFSYNCSMCIIICKTLSQIKNANFNSKWMKTKNCRVPTFLKLKTVFSFCLPHSGTIGIIYSVNIPPVPRPVQPSTLSPISSKHSVLRLLSGFSHKTHSPEGLSLIHI